MSKSFKFAFEAAFPSGVLLATEVTAVRPVYNDEEYRWEPITTTFNAKNEELTPLMTILTSFYSLGADLFKDTGALTQDVLSQSVKDMLGTAKLSMLVPTPNKCPHCQSVLGVDSGPLKAIEEWEMHLVWPHSVDFGDLCYSSSTEVPLRITWRFQDCEYRRLF